MKKALRFTALLLAVLMMFSLASCKDVKDSGNSDDVPLINVFCAEGIARLGIEKIISDHPDLYNVTVAPEAQVRQALADGSADIAICSVVGAARLSSQTSGETRIVAATTANNLYVVAPAQESFPENFGEYATGKKIYTAKDTDADAIMEYLLLSQNIDCEIIKVDSEKDADVFEAAKAANSMCVLSEPYVTTVEKSDSGYVVLISVNEAWKKVCNNKNTPLASCAVTTKEFAEKNSQAIESFISHYQISVNFVNYSDCTASAALFSDKGFYPDYDSAVYSLGLLKLAFLSGEDMRFAVAATIEALGVSSAYSDIALPAENIFY